MLPCAMHVQIKMFLYNAVLTFFICCYAQFSKNIKLAIDIIFVDNLASVGKKVMVQVNSLQIIIVAALLCEYHKSGIFVVKIFL